jgi:hypothetical protein
MTLQHLNIYLFRLLTPSKKVEGFARMLFDRSGKPWPKDPEQFIHRIVQNANQINQRVDVFAESTVSLTPQQIGVLLG